MPDTAAIETRLLALEWLTTSLLATVCLSDDNPGRVLSDLQRKVLRDLQERIKQNRPIDLVGQLIDLPSVVDRLIGMAGNQIARLQRPDG